MWDTGPPSGTAQHFHWNKRHFASVEAEEGAQHICTLKQVSDMTRSWRSAEDEVNTLLECYTAVTSALEEISSQPGDSGTVNLATSLLHQLQEFEVVVCLLMIFMSFYPFGFIYEYFLDK